MRQRYTFQLRIKNGGLKINPYCVFPLKKNMIIKKTTSKRNSYTLQIIYPIPDFRKKKRTYAHENHQPCNTSGI